MTFWLFLFIYFLGSKLAEYLIVAGHSIRVVRTSIELCVLTVGWALGGTVGIGTVLFALSIGPLVHVFLPCLTIDHGTPEPETVIGAE